MITIRQILYNIEYNCRNSRNCHREIGDLSQQMSRLAMSVKETKTEQKTLMGIFTNQMGQRNNFDIFAAFRFR